MYQYKAEVVRVVDGDTVDLRIDLGFCMTTVQRCRLLGYDAPENKGATKAMAGQAAIWLNQVLHFGTSLLVETEKDDSFGRYLVQITVTGVPAVDHFRSFDAASWLIQHGYGRAWNGKPGTRIPFNPNEPYPLKA